MRLFVVKCEPAPAGDLPARFGAALALAKASDLVATVPERHTANLRHGMHTFELPFRAPEVTVSLLWHTRLDADPAHRWLRDRLLSVCRQEA
jgi:DNA-binding transcriptional LysR family regulator